LLSLVRDGLKYRSKPSTRQAGSSIAALTSRKGNTQSNRNSDGEMSKLREVYLDYALTILEKPIKIEQETVVKIQDKVLQEASWLQFLSIFNFWMKDESKNFEKTDIFIEKSVKASFDLAYNIPTQSIIDFGKFLWKEQMNGMFSKS
jgi:ubiquinone biosynthesis protein COQ9